MILWLEFTTDSIVGQIFFELYNHSTWKKWCSCKYVFDKIDVVKTEFAKPPQTTRLSAQTTEMLYVLAFDTQF